jgi:hypothetical protein
MVVSVAQDRTFEGQRVPSAGRWNIDSSQRCAPGCLVVVEVQRRHCDSLLAVCAAETAVARGAPDRVVSAPSTTRARCGTRFFGELEAPRYVGEVPEDLASGANVVVAGTLAPVSRDAAGITTG